MVIEKLDIHMQQNEIRFFSYPTCNQLKKDERIKHQTWNSNKKHRQKSFTVLVLAQAIREPPVDTCEGSPPPCPLQHFPAERGGGQQPALRVSCAVWPEGHSEAFKKSRYEERCIYWYKWSRKRLVLNNVEGRYCFRNKWQKQTFKYREHTDGHEGGAGLGVVHRWRGWGGEVRLLVREWRRQRHSTGNTADSAGLTPCGGGGELGLWASCEYSVT